MAGIFIGKTVLITGSNRGIGKEILNVFASNGANVIAHSREKTDDFSNYIQGLARDFDVKITPVFFDLRDENQIDALLKTLFESKVTIDGLVNNAGITHNALLSMSKMSDLKEQFDVNFFSLVYLTKQISRLMIRAKSGVIVNISSTAALDGNIGKSYYGSSKGALNTFTKVMSRELGPYGIRVNAIAPGMTETAMLKTFSDQLINETVSKTLKKQVGSPLDIANAVLFLVSDMSSYITGQVIRIDGGVL